jgi:hypothetical protein
MSPSLRFLVPPGVLHAMIRAVDADDRPAQKCQESSFIDADRSLHGAASASLRQSVDIYRIEDPLQQRSLIPSDSSNCAMCHSFE